MVSSLRRPGNAASVDGDRDHSSCPGQSALLLSLRHTESAVTPPQSGDFIASRPSALEITQRTRRELSPGKGIHPGSPGQRDAPGVAAGGTRAEPRGCSFVLTPRGRGPVGPRLAWLLSFSFCRVPSR